MNIRVREGLCFISRDGISFDGNDYGYREARMFSTTDCIELLYAYIRTKVSALHSGKYNRLKTSMREYWWRTV